MTIFPTQYSTLSSAALAEHVSQKFQLGTATCRLLVRNVSDTYQIDSESGKFILKIYREAHRTEAQIMGEIELLQKLQQAHVSISYPLADCEGELIQRFEAAEGIRIGVLFSFAKGEPSLGYDPDILHTVGKEIARMHVVTENLQLSFPRPPITPAFTLMQPMLDMKPAFDQLEGEYAWLQKTTERALAYFESVDTTGFSQGVCHYDCLPHNLHFDEQGQITIFDFDFAGYGLLVNDLMTYSLHFFFGSELKKITPEEAEQGFATVVEAYREVRNISDAELEMIPWLGYAFWIYFLAFYQLHFEDWANTFFNLRFKKERVRVIKRWVEVYCPEN